MSDGVYILISQDGFRVTYSKRYVDFMTIEGNLVGSVIEDCFGSCRVYDTMQDVMDEARRIAYKYHETEDGVCCVSAGKYKTFEQIVKG
jgi:hypothetical protein